MPRQSPSLLYLIKQVELAVRSGLDDVVRPHGITTPQYTAMTVLARHPDMTSAHLARHAFVTAQSMADIVKALLDRDLVERHRDPSDRRRLVLALTPKGIALLDQCAAPVAELEARMIADLDGRARRELRDSLASCRESLTP